jgi:glycosyltransferase involved in cell wall biosynthesis
VPGLNRHDLVSVVIPAYNAERFVGEAIESVLAQTHPYVECIVVDDGSTDATTAIARSFGERVRAYRQHNQGVSAARNAGARAATGSLLAFLDADDRWSPDWLAQMLEALTARGADATACAYRLVDAGGAPIGTLRMAPMPTVESLLTFQGTVAPLGSNMLIRRAAFESAGGWDERLALSQDWELLFRLLASGSALAYLDEPLTDYRQHPGSLTTDVDLLESDMTRAFAIVFAADGGALEALRRPAYARLHRMLSGSFAEAGRPWRAGLHAARSALYEPAAVPGLARSALRRARRRR